MMPEIPEVGQQKVEEPQITGGPANNAQKTNDAIQTNGVVYEQLRELMQKPFALADGQGKYKHQPAIGSSLMYINSELAEAHDAFASGRHASLDDIEICEKFLAEGKDEAFVKYFRSFIKSTFEDEMADVVLMTLSIAGYYGIDIAKHVMLKHRYNQLRQEHSAITTRG